ALGRRQVITPRVVSAAELIGDVRRLIERSLGEAVRLRIEGAPDLWPARADPARIEQVILNLVINARDAIPQGRDGGAVIIEAGNAVLDESYAAARPGVTPGRYVCLSVSDNGVGMTKEVLARVFEPFFTTKERGRGTGLGLATSFGIVRQHGGHIAVYSEPGVGSTFRVYLPAAVGEAVASRARADAPPARGRERVLLIDDHEGARDAVAGMLRMLGYTVTQAADGAGARRAVEALAGALDLVVCDVMLPDGTGPEVVEHLRAVAGWPEPAPPVVFISGYTANAVAQHGVVEPAVRFIAKPFTAQELGQLVRSALDGRSAPRAGA
ncbi:MAG: response regulator, partial [Thermoleophilia bacterium]|nr:response regulator [Thermoleophilia bacterium]